MKNKFLFFKSLAGCLLVSGAFFAACTDEDGKYQMTGGEPTVYYVRLSDPDKADSLLDGAYMGTAICLIGENFTSVKEMYFNDQKAVLNINMITNHTLLVTVPRGIPEVVDNKIYFVTGSGTKTSYDFKTVVPAPDVAGLLCEHVPDGAYATLQGDYYIDDPNVPIEITMAGNVKVPYDDIEVLSRYAVKFKVPAGSQKGYFMVKTIYGNSRSKVIFRDDRGIITNYDADYPITNSWGRAGHIENDPELSVSGNYLRIFGSFAAPDSWDGGAGTESDGLSHFWAQDNGRVAFNGVDAKTSLLKFEAYVTQPWKCVALSFIFDVTGATNGSLYDKLLPHGVWAPWVEAPDGTYTTDGWVTVSLPLADFVYVAEPSWTKGTKLPQSYDNLNIYLANLGFPTAGEPSDPEILIDNVRIVPAE